MGLRSGHVVIVGTAVGGGGDGESVLQIQTRLPQARKREITEVRYSPDGNCLAVGCKEMVMDIYHVAGTEYSHVAVCKGHSGAIAHLGRNSEKSVSFCFS